MTPVPRHPLGCLPTPLHRSVELGEALGVHDLWLKRDDLTGFAWGGNKVRAVEHLIGRALTDGARHVVVSGGPTSNFTATMAAAGAVVGLQVHQVAYGTEPEVPPPALRATVAAGATVAFTGTEDRESMDPAAEALAEQLGPNTMVVPRGGASPVGALGFALAAEELVAQLHGAALVPARIVIPVGSGGSIAGLVAGLGGVADAPSVIGVAVSREPALQQGEVAELAARLGRMLDRSAPPAPFTLVDGRGAGFGVTDPSLDLLIHRLRRATGLIIDTTYNAKALAWLATAPAVDGPTVYWHTGGLLGSLDPLC